MSSSTKKIECPDNVLLDKIRKRRDWMELVYAEAHKKLLKIVNGGHISEESQTEMKYHISRINHYGALINELNMILRSDGDYAQ